MTDTFIPHAALEHYVFRPDRVEKWGELLAPFSPPLPFAGNVISASYFCDVFVEDPTDGAIWWLNGLEERVDRIAPNQDAFLRRLANEHQAMLKTQLMEQLIRGERLLPQGMLYGLKVPRSEGGQYHPDNIGTATVGNAFTYLGELFQRKTTTAPQPPSAPARKKGWFN